MKSDKYTTENTMSQTEAEVLIGKKAHEILSSGRIGTICGIYTTACYCSYKNDDVLMMYDCSFGSVPFGIGLPNPSSILKTSGLAPGMRLLCGEQRLYSPDSNWVLAYNEKRERKHLKIPSNTASINSRILNRSLKQAVKLLFHSNRGMVKDLFNVIAQHSPQSPGNIYCRTAEQPLRHFLMACKSGDSNAIHLSLTGLIGLGPGLTPSLDDLLTGFIYTFSVLMSADRAGPPLNTTFKALKTLIPSSAKKNTSIISSAYLSAAVDGEGFSLIDDVLNSLFYGTDINASINHLLQIGNNSGADILTGILIGIYYTVMG